MAPEVGVHPIWHRGEAQGWWLGAAVLLDRQAQFESNTDGHEDMGRSSPASMANAFRTILQPGRLSCEPFEVILSAVKALGWSPKVGGEARGS